MAAAALPVRAMVIPAAGFGTRMQGITGGGCKELLEVGGEPAIRYALEEAAAAGIAEVGIVIRKGKEAIRNLVEQAPELEPLRQRLRLYFFLQPEMNGEGGAILAAEDMIAGRPFLVHYPDNIINGPPGAVAGLLQQRYADLQTDLVSLCRMGDPKHHQSARPVGLEPVARDLYLLRPGLEVRDFPFNLRTTGVYIATSSFLEACREILKRGKPGEVKDREVHSLLSSQGHRVYGLDVKTVIFDVGSPEGYLLADHLKKDHNQIV